jgi:hypothetical protein
MSLRMVLLAVALPLLLPMAASANSGSITDVHPSADGSTVYATYTTNFDVCSDSGYCGWYPRAWEVPVEQACSDSDDSHLTYVGDFEDTSGSQTGTDYFYPDYSPTRICLYAYHASENYFIADYVYRPGQPAASPTPSPTPTPTQVKPLTVAKARSVLAQFLRRDYGKRFSLRRNYGRSCYRYSTPKVRCYVRWVYKTRYRYSGYVTMQKDPDHPASLLYTTAIHRKRLHQRPKPAPKPVSPRSSCDPNYSGCLDPNASDYDCAGGSGDGPKYTGEVRVLGNDHYDLDRDGDGIACDT